MQFEEVESAAIRSSCIQTSCCVLAGSRLGQFIMWVISLSTSYCCQCTVFVDVGFSVFIWSCSQQDQAIWHLVCICMCQGVDVLLLGNVLFLFFSYKWPSIPSVRWNGIQRVVFFMVWDGWHELFWNMGVFFSSFYLDECRRRRKCIRNVMRSLLSS